MKNHCGEGEGSWLYLFIFIIPPTPERKKTHSVGFLSLPASRFVLEVEERGPEEELWWRKRRRLCHRLPARPLLLVDPKGAVSARPCPHQPSRGPSSHLDGKQKALKITRISW